MANFPPERDPDQIERAVLRFLLNAHPDRLTEGEVARAMLAYGDLNSKDAVERAIRELHGAGLLHRHGEFVQPTRAALYYERLERLG